MDELAQMAMATLINWLGNISYKNFSLRGKVAALDQPRGRNGVDLGLT